MRPRFYAGIDFERHFEKCLILDASMRPRFYAGIDSLINRRLLRQGWSCFNEAPLLRGDRQAIRSVLIPQKCGLQ